MELLLVLAVVLVERARLDLPLRRAWARLDAPRPSLAVAVPRPVALAGLQVRTTALRLSTLGLAYVLWRVYWPPSDDAYSAVNVLMGQPFMFLGLAVLALVAVSGGRDRGDELMAALPGGGRVHVAGWACTLAVAAAAAYAVVLVGLARRAGTYPGLLPHAWDVAQVPALVLGGGLLGLLAARLLPGLVAAPVAVIAAVAWVVLLSKDSWGLQMVTVLVEWVPYREDGAVGLLPGSVAWHNAFLFGLCALGLVSALLVEAGRRRPLLVAGGLLVPATALAGALALP